MEIKAQEINVAYEDKLIIKDLNLCLNKNEITTIIGPNGCGKSTLLKAITRILKKTSGIVTIDGKDMDNLSTKDIAKKVAILSQQNNLPQSITVEELISYGRVPHQKWFEGNNKKDNEIIDWAMKLTKLDNMRKRNVNSLSGGEKQRAWIATALAQKPQILFLDEPTTYLDVSHQLEVMNLVRTLNKEYGIGIVMVLHDLSQALEYSDRIIVMKCGKIYNQGTSAEVVTPHMLREVYNVDAKVIKVDECPCPMIFYKKVIN